MTGQNRSDFIYIKESADERSGKQIVSWIDFWWKGRKGAAWGGRALKRLSPDDWFELHTKDHSQQRWKQW